MRIFTKSKEKYNKIKNTLIADVLVVVFVAVIVAVTAIAATFT